jgi:hypothetical protein
MTGTIFTEAEIAIQQKETAECNPLILQKTCNHDNNGIKNTQLKLTRDSFDLVSKYGSIESTLVGKHDGTLKWNEKNIVRTVNGLSADDEGNVALGGGSVTIKLTGDCEGEGTFSNSDSTCEISVELTKEIDSGNDVQVSAYFDSSAGSKLATITVDGVETDIYGGTNIGGVSNIGIGTIIAFAGNGEEIPSNTLLCDGREVSRETYSYLFDVIGTLYGEGDGSTTFNLPDLRNRFIEGCSELSDVGTYLEAGLPDHSHTYTGWSKYGAIS